MAGAGEEAVANSKKRKQREEREESSEQDCDKGGKRTREAAEEQTSTCHQERPEGPPDRASAEPPATDASPEQVAKPQEGDSRAQAAFDNADLGIDLTAALAAESTGVGGAVDGRASALLGPLAETALHAVLDETEGLPMAIDQPGAEEEPLVAAATAAAAAAEAEAPHPAGTAGAGAPAPAVELSLCAPAEAQATDLPPLVAGAAPPAPSKQESALLPQCAIMTGTALEMEVSTSQLEPLPPREPSQQYHTVRAGLQEAVIPPGEAGVNWDHFPNYLGDGIRARLLSLATLHLTAAPPAGTAAGAAAAAAAPFPAAVKELASNSNRVLLGAANNCELYQERVIRALAHKVQAPLLVADMYNLKVDELLKDESHSAPGLLDDTYGGLGPGGFPPDPWEVSDEDDPFQGRPKPEKKDGAGGKDSALDTLVALRAKTTARRGMPGMAYFSLGIPGARQASGLAAAAAAAAAAAERAVNASKAMREKAEAAREKAEAAKERAAVAKVAFAGVERAASISKPGAEQPGGAAVELAADAAVMAAAADEKQQPPPQQQQQQQQSQQQQQDAAAAAAETAAAVAAATMALAMDGPQQPAASAVASGPVFGAGGEGISGLGAKLPANITELGTVALPAASAAPAGAQPAPAGGGAAAAAAQAGTSAAVSKAAAPVLRRGERVSYVGRVHPTAAVAQERLDQLNAAIQRVETSGSQRARDYLPQLLVRRQLVAAQSQRVPRMQATGAPPLCSKGRVIGTSGDKVQVVFDEPFAGGITLAGQKEKCGCICSAEDLQVVEDKEDPLVSSLQALFDVIAEAAEKGPLIVFIQNLDRLLRTHATDHFRKLEVLLAGLPPRCLLFAGYCSRSLARAEAKREGGPPGLPRFFGSLSDGLGAGGMGDELSMLDRFGRGPGRTQRKSTKGKLLSKMLPNHLELHPPNQDSHAKAWKKMVESDVATMRQRSNRTALRKALARCGMACDDWDAVSITDCQLSRKEIEQIVGMAVAEQLTAEGAAVAAAGGAAAEQAEPELAGDAAQAQAVDGAAPMERCGSAEAEALITEEKRCAAAGSAAAAGVPGQQQVQQPAAGEQQQPSAMQTEEAAPAEATTAAAGPAATTAGVAAAVAVAAEPKGGQVAGTAGGTVEKQPEALPWTLRAEHVMAAAEALRKMQAEAAAQPDKQALRDVAVDQYEKQLLSEVIPPEEINVSFDDIGALDAVKNTLHEVVILPLQRPELFMRGSLTKPTKGLLLFGPPGTGKTMLAKAVASESGAHFINVNMSAITSKWFGEGERLVRALFGLAHKLSPSVIFVDEIDSFLSKRGQSSNEHEALRKMKNEFMQHWDGLRTKQADRVLVLAATNRPMDLDDAVIRRMPRRIFVPLPDAANRERILQVILKDEALDPAFDFKEAAALADGYSGSDLKNLCIAAAYCPIREYLEKERAKAKAEQQQKQQAGGSASTAVGEKPAASAGGSRSAAAAAAQAAANSSATPAALAAVAAHVVPQPVRLRSISMADFKEALKQVTASTHSDSATTSELQRWNDQYGEGGSRRKEPLAYYT